MYLRNDNKVVFCDNELWWREARAKTCVNWLDNIQTYFYKNRYANLLLLT